jgi:hypothetical protein
MRSKKGSLIGTLRRRTTNSVQAARNGEPVIDRIVGRGSIRARQPLPQDPSVFGEGSAPEGEEEAERKSGHENDAERRQERNGHATEDGEDDRAEGDQRPLNVQVP